MINLAFLDENFNIIKYFKFINLQWMRKYYEPGEFLVKLPAGEYASGAKYVFTKSRPEVGIIQKRQVAEGYDGEVIQLSGYFYEYKLQDKITVPRFLKTGNIETLARSIVSTYKEDIPLLVLGQENNPLLGSSVTKESTGDGLATVLYELLQSQELSYRLNYNFTANTMTFEVWQGKDRTQDQHNNSYVTFSESFRNMQNEEVTVDSSNYKNYAVVIGNGKYEDGQQIRVDVDIRPGLTGYKQIKYVDATGETFDGSKESRENYEARLRQKGLEDLAKYADVTNVTFDTIDRGLTYMKDYDLGDKCDIILDSVGMSFTVRIVEVDEVWKESKHTVTLQFGEKVPTVYSKARR